MAQPHVPPTPPFMTAAGARHPSRPAQRRPAPSTTAAVPHYELRSVDPEWSGSALRTYVVLDRSGAMVGMIQLAPALQTAAVRKGLRRMLRQAAEAEMVPPRLTLVSDDAAPIARAASAAPT